MECFSGIQFIAEIIRVDTHEEAGLSTLVLLCLSQKITAVEEGKTVTFPPGLCSALCGKHHKWIVVMAGGASGASNRLNAVMDLCAGEQALHGVTSVEADKIKVSELEIRTGAHDTLQINGGFPFIFHSHASGDNVLFLQDTVIEMYIYVLCAVLQRDD